MISEEDKARFKAKWEAETAHRNTIIDRAAEADRRGDRDAMLSALQEMLRYDRSLQPCEHGIDLQYKECPWCNAIARAVYGFSNDEDEEDPDEH